MAQAAALRSPKAPRGTRGDDRLRSPPECFRTTHAGFLGYLRVECGLLPNSLDAYGRDAAQAMWDLHSRGVRSLQGATPRMLSEHLAGLKTRRGLDSASI